jgi:flagellar biosynthesis/type III secretory pathway chaperone
MKTDKSNKMLWDIKTSRINEIAYSLLLKEIEQTNNILYKKGSDVRASYCTLSDFIHTIENHNLHNDIILKAKSLLRKEKLNRLNEI